MSSKLDKLKKKVAKLEKERYNASKNNEYHTKCMVKAERKNNPKSYLEHKATIEMNDAKIARLTEEIEAINQSMFVIIKEEEHAQELKRVRKLDFAMREYLLALVNSLDNILAGKEFDSGIAGKLYDFYVKERLTIPLADQAPYEQLNLRSVRQRYGNIIEDLGKIERIGDVRGSAVARGVKGDTIGIWVPQLKGQILDCIKTIEARSKLNKKSLLGKIKERVNGGS